jgi:hypothetical protein
VGDKKINFFVRMECDGCICRYVSLTNSSHMHLIFKSLKLYHFPVSAAVSTTITIASRNVDDGGNTSNIAVDQEGTPYY